MPLYDNVPGISTELVDGNLRSVSGGPINDSILIIGTAGDGPVNEPVNIQSVSHAVRVFGNPSDGDLVRGVIEAWNGKVAGNPDIRAVRLEGGQYAAVEIPETSGTTAWSVVTDGVNALELTAKTPGAVYNNFKIRAGTANGRSAIIVDNPKTGVASTFTYKTSNLADTSAEVHTVAELADAINADRNLNPYIEATYDTIDAYYGLEIGSGTPYDSGITITDERVTLSLTDLYTASGAGMAILPPGETSESVKDFSATVIDKIHEVEMLYEVAACRSQHLRGATNTFNLPYEPRLLNTYYLTDIEGAASWPDGAAETPEYRIHVNAYASEVATADDQYTFIVNNIISPPDLGYYAEESGAAAYTFMESYGTKGIDIVSSASGDYTVAWAAADASGLNDVTSGHPRFKLKITSMTGGTETVLRDWSTMTVGSGATYNYNLTDNTFASGWDPGEWFTSYDVSDDKLTITIPDVGTLRSDAGVLEGETYLRVSFVSVRGALNEVSMSEVASSSNSMRDYAIQGNQIVFGDDLQHEMEIGFQYFEEYSIFDGETGEVKIQGNLNNELYWMYPSIQPGTSYSKKREVIGQNGGTGLLPDGTRVTPGQVYAPLSNKAWEAQADSGVYANSGAKVVSTTDVPATIGLKYTALPEFFSKSVTYRLTGGTNGNFSDTQHDQRYNALETALDTLDSYPVDYVVPMGCYLDALKKTWALGSLTNKNANYYYLLSEWVELVRDSYADTRVLMTVKPPSSEKAAAQKQYYEDLTVFTGEGTSAADAMANFAASVAGTTRPHFIITAGPVQFVNDSAPRAYTGPFNAAYAGFLSSFDITDSPTNKRIPGIRRSVFDFRGKQLNQLTNMGFVVLRKAQGSDIPVVNMAVTAADPTSDYFKEHNMRVATAATRMVREAAEPYLGKIMNLATREALKSALIEGFEALKSGTTGGINDYDFMVTADAAEAAAGRLNIAIRLWPAFEITSITLNVRLMEDTVTITRE